jgi:hypothetical protein
VGRSQPPGGPLRLLAERNSAKHLSWSLRRRKPTDEKSSAFVFDAIDHPLNRVRFEVTKDVPRSRHYRRRSPDDSMKAQPNGIYDAPGVSRWSEGSTVREEARLPQRAECGCLTPFWARWRACRAGDSERVEPPTLAFYCLACTDEDDGRTRQSHDRSR